MSSALLWCGFVGAVFTVPPLCVCMCAVRVAASVWVVLAALVGAGGATESGALNAGQEYIVAVEEGLAAGRRLTVNTVIQTLSAVDEDDSAPSFRVEVRH